MIRTPFLFAAASLFATPAAAQDNGLSCMVQSYTEQQKSQIAELAPDARMGGEGNPAADTVAQIAVGTAFECGVLQGWSEDQTMFAAYYELGRVMERGYRESGELTVEQLATFDATLAKGDRTALWALVENVLVASMIEGAAQPDSSDYLVFGMFFEELSAVPDPGFDEKVGMLLGLMSMQEYSAREFTRLAK